MDKRITTIVNRTRTLLRFYCKCGQLGIARRDERRQVWECPKCHEKRKIPETSEVVLRFGPEELVPGDEAKDRPLSEEARKWGEALASRLQTDNVGVGKAELAGYYCLRLHLSDDLDEYLRITTIDIEESRYLLLTASIGKLVSPDQALPLLEYVTHFAKIELSGDDVSLRWLMPLANVTPELLHEVALSLTLDASLIRSTVLAPRKKRK
ncbi:MAG: hypothetical protein HY720_05085 [Planctomycetes bacterium]|nr:hypothetical protein [Planctomycetota bacterium]